MIAAGIAIALLAAIGSAFAVVYQASEARLAPEAEGMRISLLTGLAQRPRWLLGSGLQAGVWGLQVVALSFAPIAIVQPMLATSQLMLLGGARMKLGERIGSHEVMATIALVAGLGAVVWGARSQDSGNIAVASVAPPMAVVGGIAVLGYALGRAHSRMRLLLVLGAGVAFSWADFVNKLLSIEASAGRIADAAIWGLAAVAIGAAAFLEENTALQERPAVTVSPVIAAIKVPLPVLMAIWAGVARTPAGTGDIAILAFGLALVAAAAAALGRSRAVLSVSRPAPRAG